MTAPYDRNSPNSPGEIYPHRRYSDPERHEYNPLPYTVDNYIVMELPTGFLDADRFAYITEDSNEALNRSRSEAWVHSWLHWRVRGVLDSTSVGGPLTDMPFVRCYEERGYQRSLFELLNTHRRDTVTVRTTFPIIDVSLDVVVLDYPYDRLPFIAKPEFLAEDSCCEALVRANQGLFVGLHNFQTHEILPRHRPSVYVPAPSRWPQMSLLLSVPNPFVLSYHSGNFIRGTAVERNNVYWVARSEVTLFALMHFLAIARDGCSFYTRTKDPSFIFQLRSVLSWSSGAVGWRTDR